MKKEEIPLTEDALRDYPDGPAWIHFQIAHPEAASRCETILLKLDACAQEEAGLEESQIDGLMAAFNQAHCNKGRGSWRSVWIVAATAACVALIFLLGKGEKASRPVSDDLVAVQSMLTSPFAEEKAVDDRLDALADLLQKRTVKRTVSEPLLFQDVSIRTKRVRESLERLKSETLTPFDS